MLTRRAFLSSSAALVASAGVLPAMSGMARAAPNLVGLVLATRTIEVRGRAADVLGILNSAGGHGLDINRADGFAVRLRNDLAEPSLIHWHGLTPPSHLDGVPGLSQNALEPGTGQDYVFDLARSGTFWMHSHVGGQEQQMLAAPLIVRESAATTDEQDVTLLLHDFSFRSPDEIFFGLTGRNISDKSMAGMDMSGGMSGMDMSGMDMGGMAMDLNDVEFDAFLANDRDFSDPEIVAVELGGMVRLRIINAGASSNFWIDTGALQGELIAVDGLDVVPVAGSRFEIGMAQRLDIRVRIANAGAFPIVAIREGSTAQTGLVLATKGAKITQVSMVASAAAAPVLLDLETRLVSKTPLMNRAADRVLDLKLGGGMADYYWTMGTSEPLTVATGERVEIVMRNNSMMSHPIHLHGHHFQVVGIGGRRFAGAVRDTVIVPAMETVTIAFDTDNPGRWAFHCHNLYHMLAGMMTSVEYSA